MYWVGVVFGFVKGFFYKEQVDNFLDICYIVFVLGNFYGLINNYVVGFVDYFYCFQDVCFGYFICIGKCGEILFMEVINQGFYIGSMFCDEVLVENIVVFFLILMLEVQYDCFEEGYIIVNGYWQVQISKVGIVI